ncbi:hypothetical protein [Nocardia transvalensis]|uniref:hypothetical protein n=1 Tax=Nocardia transvalensis TaxID=37333 RepID=UPI0018960F9F|nr:hypothetical protein [Nocardia transvalensis]MBF6333299.1 hypothetical protein [Nocardia transvalensis]
MTGHAGLRHICTVLGDTAAAADERRRFGLGREPANWSAGGRELAKHLDPTTGTASLGNIDFDIEPGPDDLRPYLNGWSPDDPHKDYHRKSLDELSLSRPWAPEWELGRLRQ